MTQNRKLDVARQPQPMKFLTLADWTGMVETELFAQTYKSYGLATVRYPVLEVTATVEPFENGRGFSLTVRIVNSWLLISLSERSRANQSSGGLACVAVVE